MSIFKLSMRLTVGFLLSIGLIVFLLLTAAEDSSRAAKVQMGKSVLVCEIGGRGEVEIEADKVVSFKEGRWYFTNGSATQCYTYDKEV